MYVKSAQEVQSYWKMSNIYLGTTFNVHTKNGVHTRSGYWEEVDWRRHDDDDNDDDADDDTQAMTIAPMDLKILAELITAFTTHNMIYEYIKVPPYNNIFVT